MKKNFQTQKDSGCDDGTIKLLLPEELKERFPWMNCDDILMGSYGISGEGWFDKNYSGRKFFLD